MPASDAWTQGPSQGWPQQYPMMGSPFGGSPSEFAAVSSQWPVGGGVGFMPTMGTPAGFGQMPPSFVPAQAAAPAMTAGWGIPTNAMPHTFAHAPPPAMGALFGLPPGPPTHEDDWVEVANDRPNWESAWPQGGLPTQSGRLAPRPLSRATSRTSNTSRRRATSTSHSANTSPGSSHSAMLARYNEKAYEDEKRPPREWRADFSMTKPSPLVSALGMLLSPALGRQGSIRRRRTYSQRRVEKSTLLTTVILASNAFIPHKVDLHPYIRYNGSQPHMYLDLRCNPVDLTFRALDRRINAWDLTRFACEPPLRRIELWNPYYPWLIEVESQNPTGVTLHELFGAIWGSMMIPITNEDYYNNEMNETIRSRIAMAFNQRIGPNEVERNHGVRRVDFLMERVVLEGFVKGKDSSQWEMKIKKLPD